MKKKITVILFATIMASISIVNILLPDTIFSQSENRYLQTFPEVTWDRFKSGELASDFEVYTSDQFIFRDDWVSVKTSAELLTGKKDNGRVYFGDEEWIFSIEEPFSKDQYTKNIDFINTFLSYHSNLDFKFMMVPSKSSIMNQYLPNYAPVYDEKSLFDELQSDIKDAQFIDLFNVLNSHSDDSIYFRTDHHWTSLGAYYAYEAYSNKPSQIEGLNKTVLSNDFFGTDYRKANYKGISPDELLVLSNDTLDNLEFTLPPSDETQPMFDTTYLNKGDKYAYYQGGNHGLMIIKGLADNGKSLLVIKDSFANSMLHYLAQDFETITVVDLRYFNGKIDTIMQDDDFSDVLFIYNIRTMTQDVNLSKLR